MDVKKEFSIAVNNWLRLHNDLEVNNDLQSIMIDVIKESCNKYGCG